MFCNHALPFQLIEAQDFKDLVKTLCPSYNLPARKILSNAMLDASYQDLLEKVKNNLTEAKAVALTSDGWTGINNDSFMAATARYIDEKSGLLKSQLLECGNFTGRHKSENIAKWLTVVQETFNIKSKVVCVVTNNAANMKNAVMLSGVVVQNSINVVISDTVERVKKIVVYYKRSSIATAKLGELQKNLHHKEQKLIPDVSTRWNSTLFMLERFNENKEPIISSLALLGVTNPIEENDWVIMTDAASVLKVFHCITQEISAEKKTLHYRKLV